MTDQTSTTDTVRDFIGRFSRLEQSAVPFGLEDRLNDRLDELLDAPSRTHAENLEAAGIRKLLRHGVLTIADLWPLAFRFHRQAEPYSLSEYIGPYQDVCKSLQAAWSNLMKLASGETVRRPDGNSDDEEQKRAAAEAALTFAKEALDGVDWAQYYLNHSGYDLGADDDLLRRIPGPLQRLFRDNLVAEMFGSLEAIGDGMQKAARLLVHRDMWQIADALAGPTLRTAAEISSMDPDQESQTVTKAKGELYLVATLLKGFVVSAVSSGETSPLGLELAKYTAAKERIVRALGAAEPLLADVESDAIPHWKTSGNMIPGWLPNMSAAELTVALDRYIEK